MSEQETTSVKIPDILSVIPLRDVVVFPYMIFPLFIGRPATIQAVDQALSGENNNKFVLLLAQRDATIEEPGPDDMFEVGTVANIMRMLKLPDGKVKVLVQGVARAKVTEYDSFKPHIRARIEQIGGEEVAQDEQDLEVQALIKNVREQLEKASNLGKNFPAEIMLFINNIDEPGRLADIVMAHLDTDLDVSQAILETVEPKQRLLKVLEALAKETQMLDLQHQILNQAKSEMDKSQKEYLLRQQLKAIQDELGEGDDLRREVEEMREKLHRTRMPKAVAEVCEKQLRRLEAMHPDSAEAGVVRTYLDYLLEMPWMKSSKEKVDLEKAKAILDEDHFGLEKVKDRIIEYLAVRKLNKYHKGPILCFVGPPGVGKTSLGKSIARCLGRKFNRISLGGVRDEAEVRGHRRTYVGAMPGRVIQGIRQAGTNNPVFMLDEVDKIGSDYRGDPSAALLEVLDPEQNSDFRDHYLEVAFDLSKVLFIATANSLEPIHPAFLDRMEVISLPGYTFEEKVEIARRFLIPKQLRENGISETYLELTKAGLDALIQGYTREAGLRNLERQIGSLCRKVARRVAEGQKSKVAITPDNLQTYLGAATFQDEEDVRIAQVGVVRGLAVTGAGGDVLNIEATTMPGKGNLILTGSLGDVMKESARAALSFIRHRCEPLGLDPEVFEKQDVHVHVPEGATPKDGPSAGITLCTALLSRFLKLPVPHTIAMTGEITLTGRVLRIGGVKEKFLAAKRYGATTVIMPKANRPDFLDLQEDYKSGVEAHFVETMDEVIRLVFGLETQAAETTPGKVSTGEAAQPQI